MPPIARRLSCRGDRRTFRATGEISPVRASALILNFLRAAWDARFGASGADFRFDAQEIAVTVPPRSMSWLSG